MKIELITSDTQNETGNTILVSLDSFYWNRNYRVWVPIVVYGKHDKVRCIDSWRSVLKYHGVPTLLVKRRA
jgi:hypothetical protein